MTQQTVFIIDDEPGVRRSLAWLLGSVNLSTKGFASGEEFFNSSDVNRPGCIVLDIRLPGMSGVTVVDQLRAVPESPPVILVTAYGTVSLAVRAMRAGVIHVLEKPYDDQVLIDAVKEALSLDERRRKMKQLRTEALNRLSLLSQRERELLDLLVQGYSNKRIARHLELSQKTVEFHRANIMSKLSANSFAELLRFAIPLLSVGHAECDRAPLDNRHPSHDRDSRN